MNLGPWALGLAWIAHSIGVMMHIHLWSRQDTKEETGMGRAMALTRGLHLGAGQVR